MEISTSITNVFKNELPRPKGTKYQSKKKLIFSLMKTQVVKISFDH
jgi:hypothetical protein